ncbi:hypothetical protein N482_16055 [Pseudoalteromonas luteoviolacea NCIMB 1942]|uniref:Uncharacterized protein n=1 Tax=Pseudoalteromonas luteoviolacea NCIMB 1942 TaxID=1365253 RepID=A0A166ZVB7_9GAMM|nr:hypothetical protein N482_16055 [Pseudoalteromonas luteoviolacea NCIMB 1942]
MGVNFVNFYNLIFVVFKSTRVDVSMAYNFYIFLFLVVFLVIWSVFFNFNQSLVVIFRIGTIAFAQYCIRYTCYQM